MTEQVPYRAWFVNGEWEIAYSEVTMETIDRPESADDLRVSCGRPQLIRDFHDYMASQALGLLELGHVLTSTGEVKGEIITLFGQIISCGYHAETDQMHSGCAYHPEDKLRFCITSPAHAGFSSAFFPGEPAVFYKQEDDLSQSTYPVRTYALDDMKNWPAYDFVLKTVGCLSKETLQALREVLSYLFWFGASEGHKFRSSGIAGLEEVKRHSGDWKKFTTWMTRIGTTVKRFRRGSLEGFPIHTRFAIPKWVREKYSLPPVIALGAREFAFRDESCLVYTWKRLKV